MYVGKNGDSSPIWVILKENRGYPKPFYRSPTRNHPQTVIHALKIF